MFEVRCSPACRLALAAAGGLSSRARLLIYINNQVDPPHRKQLRSSSTLAIDYALPSPMVIAATYIDPVVFIEFIVWLVFILLVSSALRHIKDLPVFIPDLLYTLFIQKNPTT